MTTEPMRPARVAGLALLGVAAVATVLGVVTLLGGDGDETAGQPAPSPPSTTAPATSEATSEISGPPSTAAPTTTTAPATTTRPATAPTTTKTATEPSAAPTAPGSAESFKDQPVRVYNNSNIKGLADRASADLKAEGWKVVEVGNHQGRLYETTVYYRPGTPEEAAAKALGAEFKIRVEPRFEGIADSSPGLIVIVTKEYAERPQSKG